MPIDPNGRYAIETHVISYSPSATAFYLLSEPRPLPNESKCWALAVRPAFAAVRRSAAVGTPRRSIQSYAPKVLALRSSAEVADVMPPALGRESAGR